MKNTIAIRLLLASVALQPMNSSFGAETPPAGAKTFIDYFLPMPIRGALSKDVWGAPEVGSRDIKNGLEDVCLLYTSPSPRD